jgi:NAD+ synthase
MNKDKIVSWLKDYISESGMQGFVIGISGGIDSAVTSTLCAETGYYVLAVSMPIHQDPTLHNRSEIQKDWLYQKYADVSTENIDLSETYDAFKKAVASSELGYANSKARLRMTTLYGLAAAEGLLVAGTGNKVEDFGVGFFTKYGDGGVDLSPIADLTKTEVYELAKELGIPQEIQDAAPTDGLWDDGRQDEDQLGATYKELEWAMDYNGTGELTKRQAEVLDIYRKHHQANLHKMMPIPVCKVK